MHGRAGRDKPRDNVPPGASAGAGSVWLSDAERARAMIRESAIFEQRTSSAPCIPDVLLFEFMEGQLTPSEAAGVEEHLDTCAACRMVLAETVRMGTAAP